jgi:hypothetical protein
MGEWYRGKVALSGHKSPRKESREYLPTKFAMGEPEDGSSQCVLYCDPGGEFARWFQIDSITLTSIKYADRTLADHAQPRSFASRYTAWELCYRIETRGRNHLYDRLRVFQTLYRCAHAAAYSRFKAEERFLG